MRYLTQSTSGFSDPFWWELAQCRFHDPELFFAKGMEKHAVAVCLTCEVRMDCLADVLPDRHRVGVAGGLTERERRKIRRERGEAA